MLSQNNPVNMFDACHDIIGCLVAALEARDKYTEGHSLRVADMTNDLTKEMGLNGIEREEIHIAAHLHDIGKIGVPDGILLNPGKLNPNETEIIRLHPVVGFKILSKSPLLKNIALIVKHHHERWDGHGYPSGLKEDTIPLGSRIIAICDAIDAMTSKRPYRQALNWLECKNEILANAGLQFDPLLVDAALNLWSIWKDRWSLMKQGSPF
jgi:putative nucleotidyltransferase with HDIG domain